MIVGFLNSLNISGSGLTAQKLRMQIVAQNLANASTTRTEEGGPYKRRDVVFSAVDVKSEKFENVLDGESLQSVRVAAVTTDEKPPMMVYDPGHPDADKATGMVAMPNISPVTEMVNMLSASAAYKAAAEVVTVTKEMSAAIRGLVNRL